MTPDVPNNPLSEEQVQHIIRMLRVNVSHLKDKFSNEIENIEEKLLLLKRHFCHECFKNIVVKSDGIE